MSFLYERESPYKIVLKASKCFALYGTQKYVLKTRKIFFSSKSKIAELTKASSFFFWKIKRKPKETN